MQECQQYRGSPPLQRGEERLSATKRPAHFERALALGTSSGVCAANDHRENQQIPNPAVPARNLSNRADYR